MDKNLRESTILFVEIINSKGQFKRKLGYLVQIRVCSSLHHASTLIHWSSWERLIHCAGIQVVIDNLIYTWSRITCRVLICLTWTAVILVSEIACWSWNNLTTIPEKYHSASYGFRQFGHSIHILGEKSCRRAHPSLLVSCFWPGCLGRVKCFLCVPSPLSLNLDGGFFGRLQPPALIFWSDMSFKQCRYWRTWIVPFTTRSWYFLLAKFEQYLFWTALCTHQT